MRAITTSLIIVGFALCQYAESARATSLEEGLIAWWRMELRDGNIIPDASGNCHTLTILGEPSFESNIVIFNDDGNLVAEDSDALDLMGDWTTSFWVREDSHDHSQNTNPSNGWIGKIRSYHDPEGGWFSNSTDDHGVHATLYGSPNCDHLTDEPLILGEWYLLTTTYESENNKLTIYVNDTSFAWLGTCSIIANPYPVIMGGYQAENETIQPFCKGAMADIRIYDRALSEEEVTERFHAGSPICTIYNETIVRSGGLPASDNGTPWFCGACLETDPNVMVISESFPETQPALIWGGNIASECDCEANGQDPELLSVTTHSTSDTWGEFTTAFELPLDFDNASMLLRVRADDGAEIYLNENLIATIDYTPVPGEPAVTHEITVDQENLFLSGTNTLRFFVVNTGSGHFGSPTPRGGPGDCMHVQFQAHMFYAEGLSVDCNGNGRSDECDLTDGTSMDCNVDGVPDECQGCAADLTGDGVVNVQDLLVLLGSWGVCE